MAKPMNKPIRMCIACRARDFQNNLLRFQIIEKKVIQFSGNGRSLYICNICLNKKNKKIINMFKNRFLIDFNDLKEL